MGGSEVPIESGDRVRNLFCVVREGVADGNARRVERSSGHLRNCPPVRDELCCGHGLLQQCVREMPFAL
jgi:hypothetical protein